MTQAVGARRWHPPELQRRLEDLLADHFGRRRTIVTLARRPSSYSSSFPVDDVDVRLADGSELRLIVKNVSPEAIGESSGCARPEFLYEPRREIEAYRRILPHAPDGTATWYGVLAGPSTGRYQLVLERIDGCELRHAGTFAIWELAAAWIARFHRSFPPAAAVRLVEDAKVLVYDEAFYWRWLERTRRVASRRPGLRAAIDRVARGYSAIVKRLAGMPRALIHGEFYPSNILIRRTGSSVRVCPVDWEMVALGPGLMDLACLAGGWNPRAQRALLRAYRSAADLRSPAPDHRPPASDLRIPRDVWFDFHCCRLYFAVRMLGWSDAWAPPPHHAHDWLAEAEGLAERVRGFRDEPRCD